MLNNKDYVECPICHKDYKLLSLHLTKKHNISLNDFKKKYPNIPLISESYSKELSIKNKALWGNEEYVDKVKKGMSTESWHKIHSNNLKHMWNNDEFAIKVRNALKIEANSVEGKQRRSENAYRLNTLLRTDSKYKDFRRNNGYRWYESTKNKCGRIIEYNGYYLRSTWEVRFVKFCLEENIDFKYEYKVYSYNMNNETHKYFADFYLPKMDMVIEIKPKKLMKYEINQLKAKSAIDSGDNYIILNEDNLFLSNKDLLLYLLSKKR